MQIPPSCRRLSPARHPLPWILWTVLLCSVAAPPAEACVGPPPEPFCTKTLQLAIAGPPVILLPAGGTFDVHALVFLGLADFPPGSGICPAAPYTVDIAVTATCQPAGADGAGQLLAATILTGYNELTVPVTVPAGPPRRCVLSATATLTLADGMVLSERADSLACLGDPAPGMAQEPRLDLRLLGPQDDAIARAHPGDPSVFVYEITNNDPVESFTGTLTASSLNESRLPDAAGPMPPGTAVVSVSDPVAGDNFTIDLALSPPASAEGGIPGISCLPLPPDPLDPTVPSQFIDIQLQPGETELLTLTTRPWGMCADGSCSRSTLDLLGSFSDATDGRACSGSITAVDTSVPPTYGCPDSGEAVNFPPPPGPRQWLINGNPGDDLEVEIEGEILQFVARENGIPALPPVPFSNIFNSQLARVQMQVVQPFAGTSTFDIDFDIGFTPGPGGDPIFVELIDLPLSGAPTGFENIAPFVGPRLRLTGPGGETVGFFDGTLQVNVVGINNRGERGRLRFDNVTFSRFPNGGGLRGSLSGGRLPKELEDGVDALEAAFDLRGFVAPKVDLGQIFTDGFESGNVTRWSASTPP